MPNIPYGVVSTAFFSLPDPPVVLLNKLEWTALESPVMVALVLDKDPDWITLLKSSRCFVDSLVHPTPLDRLIYGFSGPDARMLAAIHIPASAFEITAVYSVLDDAAAICLGLEGLPEDQVCHPYVNVGTPNMTNSACRRSVLLPTQWHAQLSKDHPHSITLKAFYNTFLLPLQAITGQPYTDVQTWWRHAAMRSGPAGAQARSGLSRHCTGPSAGLAHKLQWLGSGASRAPLQAVVSWGTPSLKCSIRGRHAATLHGSGRTPRGQ